MVLPLYWMADVLRATGCEVVEHPGWAARTQTDGPFYPRAVIWHHDASAVGPTPNEPAYLADLSHPGAQCWVDTAGRWHLIAAGRMWHAGLGDGWGAIPPNLGNTYSIGVETDHTVGEAWPADQLRSLRRGTRALLARLGATPDVALCGHKEYAPGRKVDPDGLDMDTERRIVAAPEEDTVSWSDDLNVLDGTPGYKPGATLKASVMLADTLAVAHRVEQQNAGLLAAVNTLAAAVANDDDVTADELRAVVHEAMAAVVKVQVSVVDGDPPATG